MGKDLPPSTDRLKRQVYRNLGQYLLRGKLLPQAGHTMFLGGLVRLPSGIIGALRWCLDSCPGGRTGVHDGCGRIFYASSLLGEHGGEDLFLHDDARQSWY
jgi:hypothetical protein